MVILIIKVLLAVFAFIVALMSIVDLKSFRDTFYPAPAWRRLTSWGVVRIFCAVSVLALAGLNEFFSYTDAADRQAAEDARQIADEARQKELQKSFAESKAVLGGTILRMRDLSTVNEYLVSSLDSIPTIYGRGRAPSDQGSRLYINIPMESGADFQERPYIPRKGDIINWDFVCYGGEFPKNWESRPADCAAAPFGKLTANGYVMPLSEKSGRSIYFGTRSSGEQLSYTTPMEREACWPLGKQLVDRRCELQVDVFREARWRHIDRPRTSDTSDPNRALKDTCRAYEALYGQSCADIISDK